MRSSARAIRSSPSSSPALSFCCFDAAGLAGPLAADIGSLNPIAGRLLALLVYAARPTWESGCAREALATLMTLGSGCTKRDRRAHRSCRARIRGDCARDTHRARLARSNAEASIERMLGETETNGRIAPQARARHPRRHAPLCVGRSGAPRAAHRTPTRRSPVSRRLAWSDRRRTRDGMACSARHCANNYAPVGPAHPKATRHRRRDQSDGRQRQQDARAAPPVTLVSDLHPVAGTSSLRVTSTFSTSASGRRKVIVIDFASLAILARDHRTSPHRGSAAPPT